MAIWFVHTDLEGELLNVENIEQVSQAEGVVEFIPSFELGMTLEGLKTHIHAWHQFEQLLKLLYKR